MTAHARLNRSLGDAPARDGREHRPLVLIAGAGVAALEAVLKVPLRLGVPYQEQLHSDETRARRPQ